MNMNRREFLAAAAGGAAIGVLPFSGLAQLKNHLRYKAVAFDAFPIFDPRPVFALTTELVPGKGEELVGLWRTRQFEYTWLGLCPDTTSIFRPSRETLWNSRPSR